MKRTGGFSIITVVFVLVVLAGLGLSMSQLATTQHLGQAMAHDGRQAYYAARAGLEWGRSQLTQGSSPQCLASQNLVVEGVAVTVTCQAASPVTEGAGTYTAYHVQSEARGSTVMGVELVRTMQMSVWVKTGGA
ncbi:hypothetical protein [Thiofaba sp. EF100]|uniref:hypothetical protein n=1 Tax=Thiofaba sp. EF100 TaxID=3121274 RepID=UPI003221DF75